jgi:hypothetical protein
MPELAALWFGGARGGLIANLARYLEDRARRGKLRSLPDTAVAARFVIETVVFWAVHRHWDPTRRWSKKRWPGERWCNSFAMRW